jgi:hypothetical protein
LKKLIKLINETLVGKGCTDFFPRIVESIPKHMKPQSSDIEGVDMEWTWQSSDQSGCYWGEMAFLLDNGHYLLFGLSGKYPNTTVGS